MIVNVSFNSMTSLLNLIKLHQMIQKLTGGGGGGDLTGLLVCFPLQSKYTKAVTVLGLPYFEISVPHCPIWSYILCT
jgi:hypothetical protein